MASEIRVNQIQNRSGLTTTTFTDTGVTISGILTVSENLNVGGVVTYEDVTNVDAIGIVTARAGINLVGNDLNVGSNIKIGNASGIVTATSFSGSGANLTGITQTTINNNANNRIITGSGTANTLEGESNLTWDGNSLGLTAGTGNQFPIQIRNDFTPNSQRADYASLLNATSNNTLRLGSINSNGGVTIQVTRGNDSAVKHNLILQPDGGQIGMGVASPTQESGTGLHIRGATGGQTRIHLTNSDTGDTATDGFYIISQGAESGGASGEVMLQQKENKALKFATNNTEALRIHADGKVTIAGGTTAQETSTGLLLLDKNLTAESDVSDKNNYHLVIRSQTNSNTSKLGIAFANTTDDTHVGAAILHHRTSTDSIGDLAFYTSPSSGTTTERFRIDKDGKFYKAGNQFYPLVNYSQYASFTAASVSSNSWTDLRTILSGYSPKKAGNIIVIHHQSQCWQGGAANSSGDAMWRIQKQEGGGSWTDVIANERIMGNMDGRNYTGNSGLARHHRTVHLMGSFECAGTTINLKSQGKVDFTSVGLQWYHHSQNILQIWEYEKG